MLADDAFLIDDNLGTSTSSRHIALNGDPSPTVTEAQKLAYYWRWKDTPTMEPQFLCLGVVGQDVSAAFDTTQNRDIIFYQVAFDRTGQPNVTHPRDGKQYVYTKPTPPILISATFSSPDVTLTFSAAGGIGTIHVLMSTGGDYTEIGTAAYNATTFVYTPAFSGTYSFKLTQEGITGESNIKSVVVTGSAPVGSPPDTLSVIRTDSDPSVDAALTWVNHGGTGSVIVEREIAGTGYSTLTTLSSSTTTYTDTVAKTGTAQNYNYRVRNTSVSGYSNVVSVYVGELAPEEGSPPSDLVASGSEDGDDIQVELDWVNHGGTGDIIIERKVGFGAFSPYDTVTSSTTTYLEVILRTGVNRTYTYRVRNTSVTGYSNEDSVTVPHL